MCLFVANKSWAFYGELACVLNRLSSLLEHLAVPNEAGARVSGEFEVLRQFQTRSRTRFLTKRTEHASRSVEDKLVQHFLAARLAGHHDLDVHRNHVDTIFRTR